VFRVSRGMLLAASGAFVVLTLGLMFSGPRALFEWSLLLHVISWIVLVVVWVATTLHEDRRSVRMREVAARMGWAYEARSDEVARGLVSYPFGFGALEADIDVFRGVSGGRRWAHFVHTLTTGADTTAMAYEHQVTAVELGARYPTVDILPEDMVAAVGKRLGGRDVDFESAEFNRRWRVRARDPRYAYEMVTPRVMAALLEDAIRGFAVRVEGPYVIAWRAGRVAPEVARGVIAVLVAVAAGLPKHVERVLATEQEAHPLPRRAADLTEEEFAALHPDAPAWAIEPGALTRGRAHLAERGGPGTSVESGVRDER